jgi:CheY-like chemotaxis protein
LAHDLRNAAGTICSCLEILQRDDASRILADGARYSIRRQAGQLIHLANRILAITATVDLASLTQGEQPSGQFPENGDARRILVVDDDQDAADSLAKLLRLWRYQVLVHYDGATAISVARDLKPDICLVDIWLPGMNGYQVAELFRKEPRLKDTLLIAVSGYDECEDHRLAREAGFDHYLCKPVDISALREILNFSKHMESTCAR